MWEEISKTVGTVAPMLGTLLAPVTGGASIAISAMVSSALGVDNNPQAVAEALRSPEALEKLKQLELREKEILNKHILELAKLEAENITSRWTSDNKSGWLAKNVRPLTLIFLLAVLTVMAFSSGNIGGFKIADNFVDLFQVLAITAFGAYFGGRSFEKIKKSA